MTTMTRPKPTSADRVPVISRFLDAPRALVFEAWTRPELLQRWWGPREFTAHSIALDVRPGGTWRAAIRSPAGRDHWMRGVYHEVAAPERLVFTHIWEDGGPAAEMLVTVTFTELGGRTKVILRQTGFAAPADRDGHQEGWAECLDRLAAYLADRR